MNNKMKYIKIESKRNGTQAIEAKANIISGSKNLYKGLAIYIISNTEYIIKICVLFLNFVVNKNINRITVGIMANKQLIGNKKNIMSQFKVHKFWTSLGTCVIKVANKPNKEYEKYVKPNMAKKFALKRFGSVLKYFFYWDRKSVV